MWRRALLVGLAAAAMVGGTLAPAGAKGEPQHLDPVFVRTTDGDVTVRVARGALDELGAAPAVPCTGVGCAPPECLPKGMLVIGLSNRAAVSEGWAELYGPGEERAHPIATGAFGRAVDAPVAWAAVQTGPGVDRVRVSFRDGRSDEMAPRKGLAVLASPLSRRGSRRAEERGPGGSVVAIDRAGHAVARFRLPPWNDQQPGAPGRCTGGLAHDFPDSTGPPPADEASARTAITAAITTAFSPPPEAASAVIQDGAALAEIRQAAADRNPQYVGKLSTRIDEIRFVDASHAAVKFALLFEGNDLVPSGVGTAVLEGNTWLVTRDTVCRLLQLGGTYCPSPSKGT
jgi:hypothetical protein